MTNNPAGPETGVHLRYWKRMLCYRVLLITALVVLVLDQMTKLWIQKTLPFPTYGPPGHIPVIEGFFHLVHVGNTGAAWGILAGQSWWLAWLAVATLIAIFFFRRALGLPALLPQWSLGLICGGAIGNLVDRFAYGHVVDFLDFHFGNFIYPSFNVADSAITVGVLLYLLYGFFPSKFENVEAGPDK